MRSAVPGIPLSLSVIGVYERFSKLQSTCTRCNMGLFVMPLAGLRLGLIWDVEDVRRLKSESVMTQERANAM
jgi:hypothetical protein